MVTRHGYGKGRLYILGLIFQRSSERNKKQQKAWNVNSLIKAQLTTTVSHNDVARCYHLESSSLTLNLLAPTTVGARINP